MKFVCWFSPPKAENQRGFFSYEACVLVASPVGGGREGALITCNLS